MPEIRHLDDLDPCPFLPSCESPLRAATMKQFGRNRGREFYERALQCAQSLWLQGLPAQSLLLINRAFGADQESDPGMCEAWPLPYAAAAWVMQHRKDDQFIGNPRRHYQHLATRMVPPRRELRSWRAWACWSLACRIFPDYPADEDQIENEGIVEPSLGAIRTALEKNGLNNEAEIWRDVVEAL